MQQTRAWLFAFKRAFKANYDTPPPPNQDEFLNLLREADERQADEEGEGTPRKTDRRSAKPPARH